MTKLEFAAIALAAEVENYIKHSPTLTGLTLSLNEFRKAQAASDVQLGLDLEAMYAQHVERSCPVIKLNPRK